MLKRLLVGIPLLSVPVLCYIYKRSPFLQNIIVQKSMKLNNNKTIKVKYDNINNRYTIYDDDNYNVFCIDCKKSNIKLECEDYISIFYTKPLKTNLIYTTTYNTITYCEYNILDTIYQVILEDGNMKILRHDTFIFNIDVSDKDIIDIDQYVHNIYYTVACKDNIATDESKSVFTMYRDNKIKEEAIIELYKDLKC